jgi:hypothetical protein
MWCRIYIRLGIANLWTPRYELGRRVEQRGVYTGQYVRYGKKKGQGSNLATVCLADIKNSSGQTVADHVWLNLTDGFKDLGILLPGDLIEFHARVRTYKKGSKVDYRLNYPTQIRILEHASHAVPEEPKQAEIQQTTLQLEEVQAELLDTNVEHNASVQQPRIRGAGFRWWYGP